MDRSQNALLEHDFISKMPLPHMSFIFRHFLPMAYSKISRRETLQKNAEKNFTCCNVANIITSGSSVEGLSLPPIWVKNTKGQFVNMILSDVDMMMVGFKKPVGENHESASYLLQTNDTHPGYTLLEIVKPENTSDALKSTLGNPDVYYLIAGKCTDLLVEMYELDPGDEKERQGPALTLHLEHSSLKAWQTKGEADAVHGLTVPKWPSKAIEWTIRQRKYNWPPKNIVDDIVSKGCHVVGAGHPHSQQRDLEWRFSFSYAEIVLAECLTSVQKQCYLLFKTLHLCAFKQPKGIVTYHLKTLLYCAAEDIPQNRWTEDTIASMLLYLLDKLLYCLTHHNLPSYFIPSNNLIDAVPVEIIRMLKVQVLKAREDPVNMLLKFNMTHKYFFGPLYLDMGDMLKPVTEDMLKVTSLKESFFKSFLPTAKQLAEAHIMEYSTLKKLDQTGKEISPEEYTLPFDNAIDIYIDIGRMAKHIINHTVHPAEILMNLVAKLNDKETIQSLLKHIQYRFPNAPNMIDIQEKLAVLNE